MAPHSSTLAWKIAWMEELGRLQSMGSLRVRHDWGTLLSLFPFMHWRRKRKPLQCSCLENPRDGGAWGAAIYGVAQSQTRLKRLRSSRSLCEKMSMTCCKFSQGEPVTRFMFSTRRNREAKYYHCKDESYGSEGRPKESFPKEREVKENSNYRG